ncbi:uncharacterized protein LOC143553044 [Bidens hawaiensis]|uniref:uncharacterized protein LOC143553044 n=1 Tax=Bidens hawaiensis TaxID=980011 RepID=UPI00404AACDB
MADLDGLLNTTTALHDALKDIPNNDDDDLDGDFDDTGDSDEDDFGSDGGSGGEGGGDDGDGSGNDGGDSGDADGRELIIRQGKAFGNRINRSIKGILDQCLDGDWITFKKVPVVKQKSMFKRFKTKYRWDPRTEQNIYDGFINVLKRRFRDNMKVLRKKFKQNARDDRHEFPDDKDNFDIMCKYSPDDSMPLGKWQRMCDQWNTEQWKKRSEAGRANRKNDLCRHTGGSIGFDEHHLCMVN